MLKERGSSHVTFMFETGSKQTDIVVPASWRLLTVYSCLHDDDNHFMRKDESKVMTRSVYVPKKVKEVLDATHVAKLTLKPSH